MASTNYEPPKFPEKILRWFCREEILDESLGDLFEHYQHQRAHRSKWKSDLNYWYHSFHFLRPFAIKKKRKSNSSTMYTSYFKLAWRSIAKSKHLAFMNLTSLSIGIASFVFIFIYIHNELSYDTYHPDAERVKRVVIDFVDEKGDRLPDATTPPALAPALIHTFEEVEAATRFLPNWGNKFLIGSSKESQFFEEEVLRTDSTFFDVFTATFLFGDQETALDDINNIVITQRAAVKHFGREDVIGEQLVYFRNDEDRLYTVSGVIANTPQNSHFFYDYLIRLTYDNLEENWGWYNYYTYVKMRQGIDEIAFENKLQPFFLANDPDNLNIIYTQPLTSIHLQSNLKWELEANGTMSNIYIFSALGIFVLLISCLNYLNLSVAQSFKKFKEVGIRKTFGAHKQSLISQFLSETVLIAFLSLALGLFLAQMLFHAFDDLLGYQVLIYDPQYVDILLFTACIALFVSILSGLYPALYFSSFKVSSAVKGVGISSKGNTLFSMRRSLLLIQFALSSFMICGSLIVYEQLNYVTTKDKGLSSDQVLIIENADNLENQEVLKNELLNQSGIKNVSFSNGVIGGLNWTTSLGYPESFLMNYVVVHPGLIETLDMNLIAGRDFDASIPTDHEGLQLIVNEKALDELGYNLEDIGTSVPMTSVEDSIVYGSIVGVVQDFHFADYKSTIKPFAFVSRQSLLDYATIKIEADNIRNSIDKIERSWLEISGGIPMEYSFLDETFNKLHLQEAKLSKILVALTTLSILVAIIGMYAIARTTIKDRLKEIAIRKVLGSTVLSVSQFIINKFLIIVGLANLIAIPVAIYLSQNWLNGFEYRITPGVGIYGIAVVTTLLVAWLTVGYQSLKASLSNPAKVLRQD